MTSDVGFEDAPRGAAVVDHTVDHKVAAPERAIPRLSPEREEPGTALAVVEGDALDADESSRIEEQVTPFLRILQALSPQCVEGEPAWLEAARPGMLYNTATQELYRAVPPNGEGVELVICAKDYHYGAWIPRDEGGGFRGIFSPDDPLVEETKARMVKKYGQSGRFRFPRKRDGRWTDDAPTLADTGEEVELVETGQVYALYGAPTLTAANAQRVIVAFTSTQLPVYQGWWTRHTSWRYELEKGKPPTALQPYAYRWRLRTVSQTNKKGTFFNYDLKLADPAGPVPSMVKRTDSLYELARQFRTEYRAGQVKADYDSAAKTDDEVPF
jgi:hypothetical protein